MVADDTTHRFVTDTEKATWNAKADAATVEATYATKSEVTTGLADKQDVIDFDHPLDSYGLEWTVSGVDIARQALGIVDYESLYYLTESEVIDCIQYANIMSIVLHRKLRRLLLLKLCMMCRQVYMHYLLLM